MPGPVPEGLVPRSPRRCDSGPIAAREMTRLNATKKHLLCCGVLQAAGGGQPNFPKAATAAKPRPKHEGMHVLTPGEDEHRGAMSRAVMSLPLLLTVPLLVHFIDIHDCQMAGCLITHIETIMCWDVPQQTEGQRKQRANFIVPRHASRPAPTGPKNRGRGTLPPLVLGHGSQRRRGPSV